MVGPPVFSGLLFGVCVVLVVMSVSLELRMPLLHEDMQTLGGE